MNRKQNLAVTALVALTVAVVLLSRRTAPVTPQTSIVLPPSPTWSYENGCGRATAYYVGEERVGPYHTEFGEVAPPINEDGSEWVAWWWEGYDANGQLTGRPEVRIIGGTLVDPVRIYHGTQAVQWFTFWRPHWGGLYLRVPAEPRALLQFSAYGHAWYSRCSQHAHHDAPLDFDCETELNWAHDYLSVGIDPYGGVDPFSDSVVWGEERERYGSYGTVPHVVEARAQSDHVTVFLRSRALWALKHNDVYWDAASLVVLHRLYFPVVGRGAGLP